MAAAYSARQLGIPATIVVPSVTPNPTVERLKDEGATVIVHGKVSSRLSFPLRHFDARLRLVTRKLFGSLLSQLPLRAFSKATHHEIHYRSVNVNIDIK